MTTENQPHVVYPKDWRDMVDCEVGLIAPDYASAHAIWRQYHTLAAPYLISPLGRVIDPATPIIDVNE
jgi:hypothetical protein